MRREGSDKEEYQTDAQTKLYKVCPDAYIGGEVLLSEL